MEKIENNLFIAKEYFKDVGFNDPEENETYQDILNKLNEIKKKIPNIDN
ncbi:MAG: hypothetical protein WC822_04260 [Candidatus Paceibacterota bacterium]|jgi:hypothetical protein